MHSAGSIDLYCLMADFYEQVNEPEGYVTAWNLLTK
jgi:hypothetical protein